MSNISVDFDVLNQRGSPAWFTDTFANIPTAGFVGRMFISKDTFAFYRDTGSGWDLIGGPGIGTLTGSGVVGQVSFFNGTQVLAGNNNLFWDNTNSRLGINTATPGAPLDIHGTGTNAQFNGTGTNNAYLAFQNAGASKWRIGNTYNAGANSFDIYNVGTSANALSFGFTTNVATFTNDILINSLTIGRGAGAISTNTVFGFGTLAANTSGTGNTAIGYNTLAANISGYENIAIGYNALVLNTTGFGNIAFGKNALSNNNDSLNIAIGPASLRDNTTGFANIAIGINAGNLITTGSNNVIIGSFSGTTTMSNNIVLADTSGNVRYRYDGTNNNLYGNVNFSSTIGNGTYTYTLPSATGTLALTSNLSSYLPLAGGTLTGALIGTSANFSGATYLASGGVSNVGIGTATSNSALDIAVDAAVLNYPRIYDSRTQAIDRGGKLSIGGYSDSLTTITSFGQIVGAKTNATSGNTSGYLSFLTNNGSGLIEALRIVSTGSVGIGNTNPFGTSLGFVTISASGTTYNILNVQDTVNQSGAVFQQFLNATNGVCGNIVRVGTTNAVVFGTTSDYRLKEDLKEIKGLEKVCAIKVYDFKWIDNEYRMDGVLAHELQEIIPFAVSGEKDDINEDYSIKAQSVDYSKIVPALVKAIQELNEKLVRNNIN